VEVKSWRVDREKFLSALDAAGIPSVREAYRRAGILNRCSGRWVWSVDTMSRLADLVGISPLAVASPGRGVGHPHTEEATACPTRIAIPRGLRDRITAEAKRTGQPAHTLVLRAIEEVFA
jgi:hypothetical protein